MNLSFRMGAIALLLALLQACTVNVPITSPNVSTTPYPASGNTIALTWVDGLASDHQVSQGPLPLKVSYEDEPLDGDFFLSNLNAELAARGMDVQLGGQGENSLTLRDFSILHHRVSGFSPMVTISTISADLATPSGTKRIATMVKRAKVPVWSMDEINDPCFNEPIELLVKEMAAKINREMFDTHLSDETVATLANNIRQNLATDSATYIDVYELGFSNNPAAIPALYEFSQNEREYIRLAGISGLGLLGAEQHLDHLKNIYATSGQWSDRGMALKAIGDIGGAEAMDFLAEAKATWPGDESNEAQWNMRIINLYL